MAKRRKKTNSNVPAKGRLRDIADQLWSLAIRADWDHACIVCGRNKVEAHHLVPRENEATRYDLFNGVALCSRHHRFDAAISPHQNAEGWIQWLEQHQPMRREWLRDTIANGDHLKFDGVKTAAYYIDVIESFREYVSQEDFERIVGVRFAKYLEDQLDED